MALEVIEWAGGVIFSVLAFFAVALVIEFIRDVVRGEI
jgi:hypothetical protein